MGQPLQRSKKLRPKNQQFRFPSRRNHKNPTASEDDTALWEKLKNEWLQTNEITVLPPGWSRYGFND